MDASKLTAGPGLQGLPWWVVLSIGIASIGLGILLLISPLTIMVSVVRIVGWVGIAGGAVAILSVLVRRTAWAWKLVGGAVSMLVGLILASQPQVGAYLISAVFMWLLGAAVVLAGITLVIWGIAVSAWARAILGVVVLVIGALLVFTVAVSSLLAPWLFAIVSITVGVLAIMQALRMRAQGQPPPAQS